MKCYKQLIRLDRKNNLYYFLFILFFSFSNLADPVCKIETFDRIIKTEQFYIQDAVNALKRNNCNKKITQSFLDILISGLGQFNTQWFSKEQNGNVQIIPSTIHLDLLDNVITKQLSKKDTWFFKNSYLSGKYLHAIFMEKGEVLKIPFCSTCRQTGKKLIQLNIINGKKISKTIWARGKLLVKAKAFFFNSHSSPFEKNLNKKQFLQKETFSEHPGNLFTDMNTIKYYKLNKTKKAGDILKHIDLVPTILVRTNQIVEVSSSSGEIRLTTNAIPIQNGTIGKNY